MKDGAKAPLRPLCTERYPGTPKSGKTTLYLRSKDPLPSQIPDLTGDRVFTKDVNLRVLFLATDPTEGPQLSAHKCGPTSLVRYRSQVVPNDPFGPYLDCGEL